MKGSIIMMLLVFMVSCKERQPITDKPSPEDSEAQQTEDRLKRIDSVETQFVNSHKHFSYSLLKTFRDKSLPEIVDLLGKPVDVTANRPMKDGFLDFCQVTFNVACKDDYYEVKARSITFCFRRYDPQSEWTWTPYTYEGSDKSSVFYDFPGISELTPKEDSVVQERYQKLFNQ